MDRSPVAAVVLCPTDLAPEKPANAGAIGPSSPMAGVPMLGWVVDAIVGASIRRISVVGLSPDTDLARDVAVRSDMVLVDVAPVVGDPVERLARALERLGAELTMHEHSHLLVLPSDIPQVSSQELRRLIEAHITSGVAATVLSTPTSRDGESLISFDANGDVESILDPVERTIDGTATVVCIRASLLLPALRRVTPQSWSRELLVDDALATLSDAGHDVHDFADAEHLVRVASAHDRALVETELRDRIVRRWLDRGVSIPDPRQVTIDATVELGTGVRVLPGTVLEGMTVVGDDSIIGPNTHAVDATIGAEVVAPSVAIRNADVPAHSTLQPFTRHGDFDTSHG